MKILDAATGATTQTGRTNKAIDTLSIKMVSTANAGLSSFGTSTIEVLVNTGNTEKDKVVMNDLNIKHLMEIFAQASEGYYKQTYATLDGASKLSIVEGEIKLADFGIILDKDEEIVFTIKGLTSTDVVTVHGLENAVATSHGMIEVNKPTIINDREKTFNLVNAEYIAIPQSGLDNIRITYKNGKTIPMLPAELEARARQHNSVTVYKSDTATVSAAATDVLYVLDVYDAVEMYIKVTADSYVYILDTKANA